MMSQTASSGTRRPIVGTIIGDPCGIGPEVVVKSWLSGVAHEVSTPVLIGSAEVIERALKLSGSAIKTRKLESASEATGSRDAIEVIDDIPFDVADIQIGTTVTACGYASGKWIEHAENLVKNGGLAAMVIGPIDTTAMKQAGVINTLTPMIPGKTCLFLASGPLRIAHVTDHISLREVCDVISAEIIQASVKILADSLERCGIPNPRIGVAGLNPHAQGREDREQIAPGVNQARALGINVEGPLSPDAVFRQCIEGKYDAVLAMYHDQGHIAIKTWGFAGNCVIVLGKPYPYLSVAHGVAHDIAGQGVADFSMMQNAMVTAGWMAAGRGFPPL